MSTILLIIIIIGLAASLLLIVVLNSYSYIPGSNRDFPKKMKKPGLKKSPPARNSRLKDLAEKPSEAGQAAAILGLGSGNDLTLNRSKELCLKLQQKGYNIEPDARYTGRAYRAKEPVIIYAAENPAPPLRAGYAAAVLLYRLGLLIAGTDGEVDDEELAGVEMFIKEKFCQGAAELERIEKRALIAKAGLLKGGLVVKELLERLNALQLEQVGRYLFLIATADGTIDSLELERIKELFSRLRLSRAYFELLSSEFGIKGPLEERITLDKERLKEISKETDLVQALLGNLFNSGDEEDMDEPLVNPAPQEEDENLPAELKEFSTLIRERESWERSELHKMALEKGLMLDSALEQINFWWEEQSGEYLVIKEGDRYLVGGRR